MVAILREADQRPVPEVAKKHAREQPVDLMRELAGGISNDRHRLREPDSLKSLNRVLLGSREIAKGGFARTPRVLLGGDPVATLVCRDRVGEMVTADHGRRIPLWA